MFPRNFDDMGNTEITDGTDIVNLYRKLGIETEEKRNKAIQGILIRGGITGQRFQSIL